MVPRAVWRPKLLLARATRYNTPAMSSRAGRPSTAQTVPSRLRRCHWPASTGARPLAEARIPVSDEGLCAATACSRSFASTTARRIALDAPPRAAGALGGAACGSRSTSSPCARTSARCSAERQPGRRLLRTDRDARRPPDRADRAAAALRETRRARAGHLRADARARRDQVALLRREHARLADSRASSGADEALLVTPHGRVLEVPDGVVLPRSRRARSDAAAVRARARLDHASARARSRRCPRGADRRRRSSSDRRGVRRLYGRGGHAGARSARTARGAGSAHARARRGAARADPAVTAG